LKIRNFIALLLLAQVIVSSEQQPQQAQPQQPTFRVEANYVRVDVYPTVAGRIVPDLTRDDFELLEDNTPQKIDGFEYIVVRGPAPQESRVDPTTPQHARDMAGDPRNRLFVLFLDTYHTSQVSSRRVSGPVARMLQKTIGQDDLVATMTPAMSARDVTFARHMGALESMLSKEWWGLRDDRVRRDPVEQSYELCFDKALAEELIARRREKQVLDALQDLVRHLRGIREERKAVFVISEGWRLFRPNSQVMSAGGLGGIPQVGVGPDGKITTRDTRQTGTSRYECERDKMNLSMLDNDELFRELLGEANRANASFYPVDPRGLPASDTGIAESPLSMHADQRYLSNRQQTLRTLADATDGVAVMNSNDISRGLQRVVDDLASYYLLGYYSTNTQLDGKFRNIKVRVKRQGVQVRARRGYRAGTPEELAAAGGGGKGALPTPPSAIQQALGRLGGYRPEQKFHVAGGAVPASGNAPGGSVWVVGELDFAASRQPDWAGGGEAEIVVTAGKAPLGSAKVTLPPGGRTFSATVPLNGAVSADTVRISVRLRPTTSALPVQNIAQIEWPKDAGSAPSTPMLFRRGPSTGQKYEPTADYRFRRNERVRVQVAIAGAEPAFTARMLDRSGQLLEVPVTTTVQRDAAGAAAIHAEAALSPLAAGDYAIEITLTPSGATPQQILVPVRVIP